MEEERKNLMKTGGWGVSREDGGGGGPRRDAFVYNYTSPVPSNWGPPVSTYGV